jgi:NTP pyrophosphatase (non-canonical NTP hydrolase)
MSDQKTTHPWIVRFHREAREKAAKQSTTKKTENNSMDRFQLSASIAPNPFRKDVKLRVASAGEDLVFASHSLAAKAGWYHDLKTGEVLERNVGEMLMLIVSEISEAMEGHRKSLKDDKLPHRPMIEVELADAVIRICDLAGYLDLNLGEAIAEKLAFNATREDHKPENRAKEGGKAY